MAIIVLEYVPFDSHSHWQKLSTRSIATSDKGGKLLRSQMSALDAKTMQLHANSECKEFNGSIYLSKTSGTDKVIVFTIISPWHQC